jgi:phosphatidylglycerophosphate synthase
MFDVMLRRRIDPALHHIASVANAAGLSANALTLTGAGIAIGVGFAIAQGYFTLAIILIAANRILDGVDGTVARINGPTAFGGYLDSLADYIFYVAVPLGFAWADPSNMLPSLLLLASFILTAVSFLAYAAIATQMGQIETDHGPKAFQYSSGLIEGGETILCFALMAIWPGYFGIIAYILAILCIATVGQRLLMAAKTLR